MGRLIDADAFKAKLEELQPNLDLLASMCIDEVIELIDEQPIAYNKEKVVAELEEEAKDTCMQADCSRYRACCKCRGVKNSIDIVRKGGVE